MTDFNTTSSNPSPIVTGTSPLTTYAEGVDGGFSKTRVNNTLTVSDDGPTLFSASVQITNFVAGEDVLAFVNTGNTSIGFGNIQGNYNSNTGVLLLSSAGGTATLAQWQNALRAVTYENLSDTPNLINRQVSFKVFDGNTESTAYNSQIKVEARNDSPSGTNGVETVQENGFYVLNEADFGFSDVDGNQFDGVTVFNPTGGKFFFDADGSGPGGPTEIIGGTRQVSKAEVAAGQVTFRPTAGTSGDGVAFFEFAVRDNGGTTGSGRNQDVTANKITFNVTPVNDGPTASADTYIASEDTILVVSAANGVLANDSDADGDPLTALLQDRPAHGQVTLNADGSFSYRPNQNYHGQDSFTYFARDASGAGSDPVTVTINVASVNDAPVADPEAPYATNEDTTLVVAKLQGVLTGDTDVDGQPLVAEVVQGTANGTLTMNTDGSFSYVPNLNYHGTDSFTYVAKDPLGATSNPITVQINVASVNDGPSADDDSYQVTGSSPLVISAANGVLNGDSDVENDPLSAALATGPANGQLTLNADGSFSYTANSGFVGEDSFTYRVSDGSLQSAPATVRITVGANPGVTITGTGGIDIISPTKTVAGQKLPTTFGDTLFGLGGNDQLDGGLGADRMEGGLGNDTYTVENVGDLVVETDATKAGGIDTVKSSISYTLGANVEKLTLTGNVSIDGTGNALANTLVGNNQSNKLFGLGGNDVLDGKGGADIMEGGTGNDTYAVDNANDQVIEAAGAAGGVDTVKASVTHSLADGVEKLILTGKLNIDGYGNGENNSLTGNTGANDLGGGDGNDTVSGGLGNDIVAGNGGNDQLIGGAGDDILIGGAGADRFIYLSAADFGPIGERIDDFSQVDLDKIDLSKVDANSLLAGNQAFTFIGTAEFTGAGASSAGQLRYFQGNGNTLFQGDLDGDGDADFGVLLLGTTVDLTAGDFIL